MRLIRWYRESPPRLRVVVRSSADSATAEPSAASVQQPSAAPKRRILMVCFGNICRSPVAAGMLQERLGNTRWDVASAGTNAANGQQATPAMCTVAAEYGVDLSTHRARRISAQDIRGAELVIAMSERQAARLLQLDPGARRRIRLLGAFNPQPNLWGLPADPRWSAAAEDEIPDPSGQDVTLHRECCERLATAVDKLARWIDRREASRPMPARRPPLSAPALQGARLR